MDKPVIHEELMESYEIDFGKGKATVNEYAPNLAKDENQLNQMIIKNILHKIFNETGADNL